MTGRAAMLVATVLGVSAAALPSAIDRCPRFIWNASASAPIGLYIVGRATQIQIDDLVVVTPPEDVAAFLADGGYLPRGVPLLKRVLALPGQTVCRIGRTITVDSHGCALPLWQGCRVIAEGDVFLMNRQSADSFDGRYFGPLPIASVVGRAKPLWIVRED